MELILVAVVLSLALAVWVSRNPRCPQCRQRRWDRRIARPLWMCRGCAARVDRNLRRYN